MTDRIPIADLNPSPYNPRRISDAALAALVASIRLFSHTRAGWTADDGLRLATTITVNRQGNRIVGGHQRVKALAAAGQDWISAEDVSWVDMVPDSAEERALNVTLNNPRNQGEFTEEALALIEGLQTEIPEMTSELDLDGLLADIRGTIGVFDAPPGDLPALPSGEREPIQQMTFTVADEQVETIKAALAKAKAAGPFVDTENENSNGNALARIAEAYLGES